MTRLDLSPAEQHLLMSLQTSQSLLRPAFAGRPFKLSNESMGTPPGDLRFGEVLVDYMVSRDLLTVCQATYPMPGTTYRRPFTVQLSKLGQWHRDQLIAERANPAVHIDDEGFACAA